MRKRIVVVILLIFFILAGSAYAKDGQPLAAEDIVAKMTTELNLTNEQAKAVTPIVEKFMRKRQAYLESREGEFVTDQESIKLKMRKFQREENQELSEIFSEEQMQKLKEKERLKNGLNKDDINYAEGVGTSGLSGDAASIQF